MFDIKEQNMKVNQDMTDQKAIKMSATDVHIYYSDTHA